MNSLSRLVPANIKAQCSAGIKQLTDDNVALDIANQSIDIFINDDSIKSVSFNSMKQQFSDYKAVICLLKSANDSDIMDYQWLYNLVGTDVLSGNVVDIKQITESNLKTTYENIELYKQKAQEAEEIHESTRYVGVDYKQQADDYWTMVRQCEAEAEIYETTIQRCQEIIDEYDHIEENTKYLFTESISLRELAREALLDMQTTFRNSMYIPNQLAPWRNKYNQFQKIAQFKDALKTQFGFDDKTVSVLWNIYDTIQNKYADLPQKERDWYFTRSISQMAGYNNKPFKGVETHAWRNGAGKVFDYDIANEEEFFCTTLGISQEDYEYMRQMVRLQHEMCSSPEKHDKETIEYKFEYEESEYNIWKEKMENATNTFYTDEEYMEYFLSCYNRMADKGDFSHMLYTISTSFINEEYGAKAEWNGLDLIGMGWDDLATRQDIAGWLGDAVYLGTTLSNLKTAFGNDDFISDLDADNIIHRMSNGKDVVENITQYYKDIEKGKADDIRIGEFLTNNPFEKVSEAIFSRINVRDNNNDGIYSMDDIKTSSKYEDTYKFLMRLKEFQEGKSNENH